MDKKNEKRKIQVDFDVYISRRSRQFKGLEDIFSLFFFNLQTTEGERVKELDVPEKSGRKRCGKTTQLLKNHLLTLALPAETG